MEIEMISTSRKFTAVGMETLSIFPGCRGEDARKIGGAGNMVGQCNRALPNGIHTPLRPTQAEQSRRTSTIKLGYNAESID
jgi:hypothetical protein